MRPAERPRVAKEVVDRINRVEARHKGQLVAIEPETGDYFISRTAIEAFRKARKKHPDKAYVFKRIGFRWTHRQVGGLMRVPR